MNYLTLEFQIIGLTYDEIFTEKIEETSLDTIFEDLKRNTIQHDLLLV